MISPPNWERSRTYVIPRLQPMTGSAAIFPASRAREPPCSETKTWMQCAAWSVQRVYWITIVASVCRALLCCCALLLRSIPTFGYSTAAAATTAHSRILYGSYHHSSSMQPKKSPTLGLPVVGGILIGRLLVHRREVDSACHFQWHRISPLPWARRLNQPSQSHPVQIHRLRQ